MGCRRIIDFIVVRALKERLNKTTAFGAVFSFLDALFLF